MSWEDRVHAGRRAGTHPRAHGVRCAAADLQPCLGDKHAVPDTSKTRTYRKWLHVSALHKHAALGVRWTDDPGQFQLPNAEPAPEGEVDVGVVEQVEVVTAHLQHVGIGEQRVPPPRLSDGRGVTHQEVPERHAQGMVPGAGEGGGHQVVAGVRQPLDVGRQTRAQVKDPDRPELEDPAEGRRLGC